ncbi:hypothetical protein [Acanthopleuribacter pedis]|uniref:Uncharacterized protein n=1 Tax=Acanthopleuribacter pedis TaxID=442870 RepID=A0A8J7Q2W2_9BACT|nr:hypothetical protein [Acanthopleuribacter pedis]MBO1319552.1 hypothetical protein [Acanthopleuribacter pedis]
MTQFKPVDISDLVQLSSGDFGYSLPAVMIPGAPGGSYPIALSYQAGIKHGQEATWVGLGWNLHPGTVSRFVRSVPDDDFGALKVTETPLPSVYTYGVGFGYEGFNIGVNWDNHGGFGGEVGYSFSGENKRGHSSTGSPSLSFHNRNSVSGSVGISHSGSGGRNGFSINSNGGIGLTKGGNAGLSTGISISSGGDVSMNHGFLSRTKSDSVISGQVYSSSNYASVGMQGFNFGFGRSSGGRILSYSESWGSLHFEHIGESWPLNSEDPETVRRKLDLTSNATGDHLGSEEAEGFRNTYQERASHFEMDTTYQRKIRIGENEELKHISVSLDSYNQNLSGAYSFVSSDDDTRESVHANDAFLSDYTSISYDGYSVAAQGLSGLARPVKKQRGFLGFAQSSMATRVTGRDIEGEWYFHGYRNLYRLMEAGIVEWDAELNSFFKKSAWTTEETQNQDNMVMLNDPALQVDHHFFGEIGNQALQNDRLDEANIRAGDVKHKTPNIEHRSQRIRYELDEAGRIARIIVTKADGITYTFGLLVDASGLVTAGARPMNHSELRESQRVHHPTDGTDAATHREYRGDPYAYSWHLAAVTSPDFVDNEPTGHYGPEDFGEYVTFHYALTNPSYRWQTPYGEGDEQPFALIGRSAADDKFTRERGSGVKDFYHLLYAKTRTHLAVFDHNHQRLDNQFAKPPANLHAHQIVYRQGLHFNTAPSVMSGANAHPDHGRFMAHFGRSLPADQRDRAHLLVLFPPGTVAKLGAETGQPVPIQIQSVNPFLQPGNPTYGWPAGMTYLGSWNYGHYEVFQLNLGLVSIDDIHKDPRRGPFASITVTPKHTNGSVALDAVRVFRRDASTDDFFVGRRPDRLSTYDVNAFFDTDLHNKHLSKTRFHYGYDLAPGYANVLRDHATDTDQAGDAGQQANPRKAKLTLKEVSFHAAYSDLAMGNSYQFEYYTRPETSLNRGYYAKDPWGFPSQLSTQTVTRVDPNTFASQGLSQVPAQAADSLAAIITPVGTKIRIEYESDRYSWVQDRAALNRAFPHGAGQNAATPLVTWHHLTPGSIRFSENGKPLGVEHILASLAQMTWSFSGANAWPEQVAVFATGTSRTRCAKLDQNGNCDPNGAVDANRHRFVVPTRQQDTQSWSLPVAVNADEPGTGIALHPAVKDLANWIWHEMDHRSGNLIQLEIHEIPGRMVEDDQQRQYAVPMATNFQNPFDAATNTPTSLGELGGGLRVAAIHSEPSQHSQWFGERAKTTLKYTYEEPRTGVESGVIFADPPKYIHGIGGDQRIVRGEALPSLTTPGADVHYGSVTTRVVKPGQVNGATHYRLLTANEPRIIHHSFTQSVKRYDPDIVRPKFINWVLDDPETHLFRFHPRGNEPHGWEAIPMNWDKLLSFTLSAQIRNRVSHNGDLIGQVAAKTVLDSQNRPVSRTQHRYQGAYEADHPSLPVKRFYRDATGRIQEKQLSARYESDPGLNPRIQGAYLDKNFGLAIGRLDGEGYQYQVNAIFQDEIWNTYRRVATTQEVFERVGDTEQIAVRESQVLALDYSTGHESIGVQKVMSPQGGYRYLYSWQIPAHEIWDAENEQDGMKTKNMLTQPGFSMSFLSDQDLTADPETPWLAKLEGLPTQALNAQVTGWTWTSFDQGTAGRWLQSAAFQYQPNLSRSPAQVLQKLPLPNETGITWQDSYRLTGGGRWESEGQVTRFDPQGNAIETRDRLGNYHSLIYEPSSRRVIAKAVNAKHEQIFFEDFEYGSAVAGTDSYPPGHIKVAGYTLNTPPTIAPDTKTAETFMAQFDSAYTGRHAATGSLRLLLDGFVKAPERPYYLSFYCKPSGDQSLTITTSGSPVLLTLQAGRQQDGKVHVEQKPRGWLYVVIRLTNDQVDHIQLGSPSTLIDAVALYPAANDRFAEAVLNHYSYDPLYHHVESITDGYGSTVRYQFNAKGQLWRTYDTDGDLATEHLRIEHQRLSEGPPPP